MNYIVTAITRGEQSVDVPNDMEISISLWARHIQGTSATTLQVGDVLTIAPKIPHEDHSYAPTWRVVTAFDDGTPFTAKPIL